MPDPFQDLFFQVKRFFPEKKKGDSSKIPSLLEPNPKPSKPSKPTRRRRRKSGSKTNKKPTKKKDNKRSPNPATKARRRRASSTTAPVSSLEKKIPKVKIPPNIGVVSSKEILKRKVAKGEKIPPKAARLARSMIKEGELPPIPLPNTKKKIPKKKISKKNFSDLAQKISKIFNAPLE